MIDRVLRLFPSVLISVLASVVVGAEATCNEEQINTCRDAALNNGLETLRSSGDCIEKPYTEFSHLCSVKNYLPTVDYCCCRHRQDQLLCCRYHQDWNRFRCQEADDVITTRVGASGALGDLPPLEILLPSTLIPLVCIIMCCLICIVSCCWCRRQQKMKKNDPTAAAAGCHGSGSLFQRCSCCIGSRIYGKPRGSTSRSDGVLDHPSRSRVSGEDEEDGGGAWSTEQLRPLAVSQLLLTSDDPSLYPLCHCTPEDRQCPHHHLLLHRFYSPSPPGVEPSAPPAADCIPFATTDYRFHGATSTGASYPVSDHCCACVSRPYFESGDSAAEACSGRPPVVLCPACARLQPPPAYEESWTHRVV